MKTTYALELEWYVTDLGWDLSWVKLKMVNCQLSIVND